MEATGLKRRLGLGLLTLYGIGVMIGAGIYVLIGAVAGEAGSYTPLAFILAGVIAAPTAVSYAELTSRLPQSAGEAAYIAKATGSDALGAILGFGVAMIGVISAGAVLQGGVGYLLALIDVPRPLLIVAGGALLAAIAIWGAVESLMFAAILTIIEVAGLIIVFGAGVSVEATAFAPPSGDLAPALAAGALLAFFAFVGFEDMVNMAEETKTPEKTMPRAILLVVTATTLIYVLVAYAALNAVDASDLAASDRPLALVFETATGRGAGFLALIAVAAALNGILAQIVMAARVLFGLGRIAKPFAIFHKAHPRFGTPVLATVLAMTAAVILALTAPIAALAEATSSLLLFVFLIVNGALIILKLRDPVSPGFRAPWAAPVLGVAFSAAALIAPLI
jgi:amino acid transporter